MSKSNILIIEDEPSIADNIKLALERESYSITWNSTIESAEDSLENSDFQLIILDIGLPDGSGFDFCQKIRTQSDVPIVMLTARNSEIDKIVGLEIGADDYLTKPFSPRELVARVRAVLRRTLRSIPSHSGTPILKNHSGLKINLDQEAFRITINDETLPLSPHEFRIFASLLSSPGRIYSRSQLLSKAWDEPHAAMERTVDAHIKSLRAKIKKVCGKDLIRTHRGFGYSFAED